MMADMARTSEVGTTGFAFEPAPYTPPEFIESLFSADAWDVIPEILNSAVTQMIGSEKDWEGQWAISKPLLFFRLGYGNPEAHQRARATRMAIGEFIQGFGEGEDGESFNDTVHKLAEIYGSRPFAQQVMGEVLEALTSAGLGSAKNIVKGIAQGVPGAAAAAKFTPAVVQAHYKATLGGQRRSVLGLQVPGLTENLPTQVFKAPKGGELIGMGTVNTGLTRKQRILNFVSLGFPQLNELVTPIFKHRANVKSSVDSISTNMAERWNIRIKEAFDPDANGQIASLAFPENTLEGIAPTIQDVAARFDTFKKSGALSDNQIRVLEELRDELRAYDKLFHDVGLSRYTRFDLEKGGFYIPRGSAKNGALDEATTTIRGGSRSATASFQRTATLDSMAQGINGVKGRDGIIVKYEYQPFRDTMKQYVNQLGTRINDQHTGNYFRSLKDELGNPLMRTPAEDINPRLRNRVRSITNKSRGRRQTLDRATVRSGVYTREAARQARAAERGQEQVVRAAGRRDTAAENFSPDDLKEIRKDLKATATDARKIADGIGYNRKALADANRRLGVEERILFKRQEDLYREITMAQRLLATSDDVVSAKAVRPGLTLSEVEKINDRIVTLYSKTEDIGTSDRYKNLNNRVDKLTERGDLLKDLSVDERQFTVATQQKERSMIRADSTLRSAQTELRMLERSLRRQQRQLDRTGRREGLAQGQIDKATRELEGFQTEMSDLLGEWNHNKRWAMGPKPERGSIVMPKSELGGGITFPEEMAEAANRILEKEMPLRGSKADVIRTVESYNNAYRFLNATMDMSATGIQGLVVAMNHPLIAERTLRMSILSLGNEDVLGTFVRHFDEAAKLNGTVSSQVWARHRLRLGGADTEFAWGLKKGERGNWTDKLKEPFLSSNRAFGFYGDMARLDVADLHLRKLIRKGRTLDEIEESGDMAKIAEAVNGLTGYSENRALGSVGDLVLFAPRFLQARLETAARGIMGLAPGASLEKRLATKELFQYVATAATLTVAVNSARGYTTDFSPEKDGRYNTNFMKIKDVFGRDISLLGPWELFPRMIISAKVGRPQDVYRGLSSGVVGQAWDLLTQSDAVGNPIETPEQIVKWLIGQWVPISAEELPDVAEKITEEGDVPGAVFHTTLEVVGGSSAQRSPSEAVRDAQMEVLQEMVASTEPKIAENAIGKIVQWMRRNEPLSEAAIRNLPGGIDLLSEINADPRVVDAIAEKDKNTLMRDTPYANYKRDTTIINTAYENAVEVIAEQFAAGEMSGRDARLALGEKAANRATEINALLKSSAYRDVKQFFDDLKPEDFPLEVAINTFYQALDADPPLEDPNTGEYDFDERKRRIKEWEKDWPADVISKAKKVREAGLHPLVKQLRDDREFLQEYWGAGEWALEVIIATLSKSKGEALRKDYEVYKSGVGFGDPGYRSRMNLLMSDELKAVLWGEGKRKEYLRYNTSDPNDPKAADTDRKLHFWGWVQEPRNPIVIKERDLELYERLQARQ